MHKILNFYTLDLTTVYKIFNTENLQISIIKFEKLNFNEIGYSNEFRSNDFGYSC
jgi:hypothetical protein